jgi:hypothetical protein
MEKYNELISSIILACVLIGIMIPLAGLYYSLKKKAKDYEKL